MLILLAYLFYYGCLNDESEQLVVIDVLDSMNFESLVLAEELARRVENSKVFQSAVVYTIVLCSIILGIETNYPPEHPFYHTVDFLFAIFFIFEIIVRMTSAGSLVDFFKLVKITKTGGDSRVRFTEEGFWNWFDFLIVLFTSISLIKHITEHPDFLIVSRLFRVLRIFRLLEISDELKMVEKRIIPTVFSFVLLLGILLYIYSIIGVYFFEHKDFGQANFSNLPSAFMTLFQLMTLDGWTDVMNSASSSFYNDWLVKGFFVSFVVFTAIISFNVFVAVLTSQVHEKMAKDNDIKLAMTGDNQNQITIDHDSFKNMVDEIKLLRQEIESLKK
ncbi:MAG: voltage-gated sodium channel [Cyclobacteriaceae bacterium]